MLSDLSEVTEALRTILTNATSGLSLAGTALSTSVSGQHPQKPATGNACDLNLYLFHVTENKFLRNGFWQQSAVTGQPAGAPARQPVAFEPLCLDLRFLLSAYSEASWAHEQKVMSVAMRALHENATLRVVTTAADGTELTSQLTVELESASWDELNRLWQALGGPLRMTALYRVGVALLAPEEPPAPHTPPASWHLQAGPGAIGGRSAGDAPLLYGTSRSVSYGLPDGSVHAYDRTPATAGPGQVFTLRGSGLRDDTPVYLVSVDPDGVETEAEVTAAWKPPPVVPPGSTGPFRLRLPEPPGCPEAGHYRLRAGRIGSPQWRSNDVPLSVAPWLDPADGPLVLPSGDGRYTVTARNVPAEDAHVLLGATVLERVSGTPGPGQWALSGTVLTLLAPAGLPADRYAVRLRAADVEADPGLWVVRS
ncbi:DUF4255 domain-containing protein [Streptomyces sp. NPDC059985]|uniref:DUF4255 domain-containing protein n=1 Tax=Streptomyces sp. NPDC059985 TaxID=3347025 RepID=UPI0036C86108